MVDRPPSSLLSWSLQVLGVVLLLKVYVWSFVYQFIHGLTC